MTKKHQTMMIGALNALVLVMFGLANIVGAQDSHTRNLARHDLGDVSSMEHWSGLEKAPGAGPDGGDAARLGLPGDAKFYYGGQNSERTEDWTNWPVLAVDVKLPDVEVTAELTFSRLKRSKYARPQTVRLTGAGWQTVYLSVNDFRLNQEVPPVKPLRGVRGVAVETEQATGGDADELLIANPRLQRGKSVGLMADVRSKAADPGEEVAYEVSVVNCTDKPQAVALRLDPQGGAVMVTTVEPEQVRLEPGETQEVTVRAHIPTADAPGVSGELPAGAREHWTLRAVPNGRGDQTEDMELIHVVKLDPPYIFHTREEWSEIRSLVESRQWAKQKAEKRIERAREWDPPAPRGADANQSYKQQASGELFNAAVAWQLSRNRNFARKVATFLRGFADPERGYPATENVTNGLYPSGGVFFQHLAWAYDMIKDADVLDAQDHHRIEAALRINLEKSRGASAPGNQPLAAVTGALYSALAIQDWHWIEYYLEGPGKLYWNIRSGIMDDGFYVEMSPGYMTWCASMFTEAGLAMQPWGVELLNNKFPAVYHENYRSYSEPGKPVEARFYEDSGIITSRWGPSYRNFRQIRDMWDTLVPLINEDGNIPGFNDGPPEIPVSTEDLFVAAYAFDKPKYLRPTQGNSLLYPVDRPEQTGDEETELLPSVTAHNAGLDLLRSQGADSPGEQYQALLSYGSHGGFHGHWDRLNMTYLRRFGKVLTHDGSLWYGYGSLMYQFGYYQSSLAHNMLIVDGKNQYPAPSTPLMFHAGDLFQASAVENKSRWSNPRYGGHNGKQWYNEEKDVIVAPDHSDAIVPVPDDHPEWGHMNNYTEPIRSRRLMATTDEYVLVIDHVRAQKKHTYDVIYQFANFKEFDRGNIQLEETRERFDDSPLRTGYFATDAMFYEASGTVRANFKPGYPPKSDKDANKPQLPRAKVTDDMQTMSVDVHTVWPRERQQVVAKNPDHRSRPEFHEGWNTYSAGRVTGREASFVTLIEVQKNKADRQVKNIEADGPGRIKVTLADGRTHTWRIDGLDAEKDRPSSVHVEMVEKDSEGDRLRSEGTD